MLKILIFLINVCCLIPVNHAQQRICATQGNSDACQQLARNYDLACNYYLHNVDCLLSIQSNISHIGRITGEEAFLGANLLSDDVVVLGEVRTHHPPSETVVLAPIGVPDIKSVAGRSLCHPGYKHDLEFSRLMLQEFGNKVEEIYATDFCSKKENYTLLEKHIYTLSFWLGDSCRPGPWSENNDFDKLLKQKYNSLCKLCGSQGCDVDYEAPFNDSIKCLLTLDKRGEMAVTTLQEAYKFFNKSIDYKYQFKYLCKDGSVRVAPQSCVWTSELPNLIVVQRNVADTLKNYLKAKIPSKVRDLLKSGSIPDDIIAQALEDILKLKRYETILLFNNYKSLEAYVKERRTVPHFQPSIKCGRTLKWCTYSDIEQEKCKWLSQAAMNWGIQPVVECVRSEGHDELSCLDDLKKDKADIVVASSDYAYLSLKKGLKSIAYPETYTTNLSTILVVKRADDNSIKSLEDLKGKRACLPRFGGKEHLAFVDTLRNLKICQDENCDYGKLLSDFVGPSCVPGVRSSLIKESTEYVDKDKLCSNCRPINVTSTSSYCNADVINKYFGSEGALKCLYDKAGDYAVISKLGNCILHTEAESIPFLSRHWNGTFAEDCIEVPNDFTFKVICKNNTLSQVQGLNVDSNCALNIIPKSEIVAKINNPKIPDIKLALAEFERWFGQNLKKPFHLFDTFNGTLDLLFLDSTPGIRFGDDNEYIINYKKLLDNVEHCTAPSCASTMTITSIFTFVTILFTFFINM